MQIPSQNHKIGIRGNWKKIVGKTLIQNVYKLFSPVADTQACCKQDDYSFYWSWRSTHLTRCLWAVEPWSPSCMQKHQDEMSGNSRSLTSAQIRQCGRMHFKCSSPQSSEIVAQNSVLKIIRRLTARRIPCLTCGLRFNLIYNYVLQTSAIQISVS